MGLAFMPWLTVLSEHDYEVVPTHAVSPMRAFIAMGRRFPKLSGVVLMQTRKAESMLVHAVKNAFW